MQNAFKTASCHKGIGGLLICLGVLASLICNSAAGLASGLAGSLALAASTVLLAKIASLYGSDMFHYGNLQNILLLLL